MSDARWRQVEKVYHAALERQPDQREAFVEQACAGDDELRGEVQSLLAHDNSSATALDQPAWENAGSLIEAASGRHLAPGAELGPFRILGVVGAGGMGEVYRARDSRLGRSVAIKISRQRFTERFEREARAISALNHPHICTLYDIGPNYLVMELIEGKPLTGPLPLRNALDYGCQILDALDAAHRKGIVHRDLKPANILVAKSGVKLLDFGLAKVAESTGADATQTRSLTAEDTIVGTLQYMSPEQVEGKDVDARSDIFAFGVVLYEMLTGRQAFSGPSRASLIASILTEDPLPPSTAAGHAAIPKAVDAVAAACLAKDRNDRWQTVRDLRRELLRILEDTSTGALPAYGSGTRKAAIAAAVATAVLLAVAGIMWFARPGTNPIPQRMLLIEANDSLDLPSISPDGRKVAYSQAGKLRIRDLSRLDCIEVPESSGITGTFWSPDSRWVGFVVGREIRTAAAEGGAGTLVCQAPGVVQGVAWTNTWDPRGVIVFAQNAGGIYRVPAGGGSPLRIVDNAPPERYDFHNIVFLGGGEDFVTWTHRSGLPAGHWMLVSGRGKAQRQVGASEDQSHGPWKSQGAWSPAGWFLMQEDEGLWVHPISRGGAISGDRILIDRLGRQPSLSKEGLLAYMRQVSGEDQLLTVDRTGRVLREFGQPVSGVRRIAVSPDGTQVAYDSSSGLWIHDFSRGGTSRLMNDVALPGSPRWSSDGRWLGFVGSRGSLWVEPADSSRAPEQLIQASSSWDWSNQEDTIVYSAQQPGSGRDILMATRSSGKTRIVANTPFWETEPEIDPSGRFVAYQSDESGQYEVYVRALSGGTGKWLVSSEGGTSPRWNPRGGEIFYLKDTTLMAVKVTAKDAFRVETGPEKLFANEAGRNFEMQAYAPMPDGARFVIARAVTNRLKTIVLDENWAAGVK